MIIGERQVAPNRDQIRRDHVARYEWLAARLGDEPRRLLDVACGVGYGAQLIAEAGHHVIGIDCDVDAIAYAREHYWHERADFRVMRAENISTLNHLPPFDAAAAFEFIEHIEDPAPVLRLLRRQSNRLYVSVPNEDVFPFSDPGAGYTSVQFHHRHYTPAEFKTLLLQGGWRIDEWWGQNGPESEVESSVPGRTIIAVCSHAKEHVTKNPPRIEAPPKPVSRPVPKTVAILGLGPSLEQYVDVTKRLGARRKLCDETWGINAVGDVIRCDRLFHMDDVRVQEIRAKAAPESNIAAMIEWLRTYEGVCYTSIAHPGYPCTVAYPLQDVINNLNGLCYFNSTAAYAVAYAIHIGVKKIQLFGCDFTYADSHDAEKGRGCVEFWLGFANARGIKIAVAKQSSLLDAYSPLAERTYGYDCVNVSMIEPEGKTVVSFSEKESFPTAAEIESAYDHSAHPNALVQGEQ